MLCPVCGEDSLSPLATLDADLSFLRVRFKRDGFLGSRPVFLARTCRMCLSCGVVLPFLDARAREELKQTLAEEELLPVEPDPPNWETPRSPESPS